MDQAKPTVLLTRPAAQSARFLADIQQQCVDAVDAVISPLIQIDSVPRTLDLTAIDALLFTSPNGVAAFASSHDSRHLPALCVGERTASAASASGMTATSAGGNAGDLVALAAAHPAKRFLHLRGEYSTETVAPALRGLGKDVDEAVMYTQTAIPLSPHALALVQSGAPVIAPLFSPRTAALFADAVGANRRSALTVVCISQAVADAVLKATATAPTIAVCADGPAMVDAVIAALNP